MEEEKKEGDEEKEEVWSVLPPAVPGCSCT